MTDPIYKPPETNPEKDEPDVYSKGVNFGQKLLLACSALIPSVVYAFGVALFDFRGRQEDAFIYVVMAIAAVLAVYTAWYQYSRSERGVLLMIAYLVRWFLVHLIVLFFVMLVVILLKEYA